ncbi:DUF4113 domain-containing protein [Klebsiella aerogenes]
MVVILTPVDGIIRWLPRGFSCSLFFAGQGINVGFAMRREMLSPEYTTDWNALPRAFMR